MDAQTIAQVKAEAPQSLWHFLINLPSTQEAQIFYALILAGILGMIANYIVRYAKNDIKGHLWDYVFKQNPRGSLLSFCTYVGGALAAIYAGAFHIGDHTTFVGWGWVLWMGAGNGFMIDNITNNKQRPVWTREQRSKAATR